MSLSQRWAMEVNEAVSFSFDVDDIMEVNMRFRKSFLVLVLLAIPLVVCAQPGPPLDRPEDKRAFERIEQLRKIRLMEILNMKEEQSVRFMARMVEHDSTRRRLFREKGEALDRLERLVRNEADNKDFEKSFDDIQAIDTKIQEEQRQYFSGLADILTPAQRAKLLLFERRFERELREAMREAQRRRHGREGP
jgi:Spy/CpxP family protein refolding chaperone